MVAMTSPLSYRPFTTERQLKMDAQRIAYPFWRPVNLFNEGPNKPHPQISIICNVEIFGKSHAVIFIFKLERHRSILDDRFARDGNLGWQAGWVGVFQRIGKQFRRYQAERHRHAERHCLIWRTGNRE